ncbi:hypothetical protein, partial [Pseudoalteromonas ruthenica]|uniref:hypothetical protein n=1 Tax=Pseudoalteromonas ruthenica TaxID=151081 RepID=UPI0012702DD2
VFRLKPDPQKLACRQDIGLAVVRLKPDPQQGIVCRQGVGLAVVRLKSDPQDCVVGKALALRLSG